MQKITVSTTLNAPLELVWRAFTQPENIVQWNFASEDWECPKASNDLRVGGVFSYLMAAKDGSSSFDFNGTYTSVIPMQGFDYEFGERKVNVVFTSDSEQQTTVTETFDTEDENSPELQRAGWQAILDNFKQHALELTKV